MARKTILLTGCGGTPTKNVVWCLRYQGDNYRIIGVDCDAYNIFLSEKTDRKYLVPRADSPDYIEVLNEIIAKEKVELVHAQPDVEVGVLSNNREKLDAPVFLPAKDVVNLCHNKFELIKALRKAGIPCAQSFLIKTKSDLSKAFDVLDSKVWLRLIRGAGGRGSLPVENRDLAKHWIDYWDGWGKFSAEEYLPGRNLAWQGIFKNGKLIGSIAWERIRYIIRHVSPSGITGTPSVAKLINDEPVHRIGKQTIEAISKEPNGVFGVDMRENTEEIPCVTEINPGRFFTPSFMYAKAGYNIVKTFFEKALDLQPSTVIKPRAEIKENTYWIRGIDATPVLVGINKPLRIGMTPTSQELESKQT
jgi:carbamoyl-phosphate synthase large subunit